MTGLEFFDAPLRQARATAETAHRPWPPPDGPWVQGQTWNDVLFAHWRTEEAELRRLLPAGLELELHDGAAWLGAVGFRVTGLRVRGLPPLPVLSSFGQLNVRTYVTDGSKPGIWFFSLLVGNPLVVEAMRRLYRMPAGRTRVDAGTGRLAAGGFRASYGAVGDEFAAARGSLEHFLAERYCQYTADGGRLYRTEVQHPAWQLRRAAGEVQTGGIAPVSLSGEPHLLCAQRQDAVLWTPEEL